MESTKNGNQRLLYEANASKATRLYKPPILTELFRGPYKLSQPGWIWWVKTPDVLESLSVIDRFFGDKNSDNVMLLELGNIRDCHLKRRYYRFIDPNIPSLCYFAKHNIKISFKKRVGGLLAIRGPFVGRLHMTMECINTAKLSINTPFGVPVLAFGEYIKYGMPKEQIIIQPFLKDYKTFYHCWDSNMSFDERVQLIIKLIDMLKILNKLQICHRDLHLKNIFVSNNKNDPFKIIDCEALDFDIISSLATAVNLGLVLYDLNGRRRTISKELEEAAQKLLEYVAANGPYFEKACRILSLLVCFSFYSKKSIKNQIFLEKKVKIEQIESKLKLEDSKYPKNQNWEAYGKKHEKELVDALNVAIKLHQKINR
jgi:serine/threonine protein kinase